MSRKTTKDMELIKPYLSLQVICVGPKNVFAPSKIINNPKKIIVFSLNNEANSVSYINYCI